MLRTNIHTRIKRGWNTEERELTPKQVISLILHKQDFINSRKGDGLFQKVRIGESVIGSFSGTLTELCKVYSVVGFPKGF